MAKNKYNLERKPHLYRKDFGNFDRWGAANQTIGVTGLLSFGFAYLIIGASVFFGK
jgi:hypothetical protein